MCRMEHGLLISTGSLSTPIHSDDWLNILSSGRPISPSPRITTRPFDIIDSPLTRLSVFMPLDPLTVPRRGYRDGLGPVGSLELHNFLDNVVERGLWLVIDELPYFF